jgi:hypothetical protein
MVTEVVTTECFPTICRTTCYGICLSIARLTVVVSSFASLLIRSQPLALPCVMAVLNGTAIGFVWLLNETKGRPIPQTIEDLKPTKKGEENVNESFVLES